MPPTYAEMPREAGVGFDASLGMMLLAPPWRYGMTVARFTENGNLPAALVIGASAGLLGFWLGKHLETGANGSSGILLGYLAGSAGFLIALGFGADLLLRLRGRPTDLPVQLREGGIPSHSWRISAHRSISARQIALLALSLVAVLALVWVLLA